MALRRFLWPVLCLFQLGVIAGLYTWRLQGSKAEGEEHPTPAAHGERPAPPASPSAPAPDLRQVPALIERGDVVFRQGRPDMALAAYQPLVARAGPAIQDALNYRIAVCEESLDRFDNALINYRTVGAKTSNVAATAAADVGQARVFYRTRRPTEAVALLCRLLLQSARPELRELPALGDARYLLALSLAQRDTPQSPTGRIDALMHRPPQDWALDRVLDWVPVVAPPVTGGPLPETGPEVVRAPGAYPDQALARVVRERAEVGPLLDDLAQRAGLTTEWTAAARHAVEGRTARVAVADTPVRELFYYLTAPLGLDWEVRGQAVKLSTGEEVPAEKRAAARAAAVQRALRDAIFSTPGHPLTPVTFLEFGVLEAADGRQAEAVTWFERVAREAPRSAAGVEAMYNLGLLRRRLGQTAAARQAYYRVVDQVPGSELAARAALAIGQMHLDDAEADQAVPAFTRALAMATEYPIRPLAVLSLAAAHLLAGRPQAANAVLVQQRDVVSPEPYRRVAAFLDALARFRAGRANPREAPDLLSALLALPESVSLGTGGAFLAGQAYQELGMTSEAVKVYRRALAAGAHGPLAERMTLAVAESLARGEQRATALQMLTSLATLEGSATAPLARFRLAEAALADDRPRDCLLWARPLLDGQTAVPEAEVLKLLGAAYDKVGDARRAARCFAGQRPD